MLHRRAKVVIHEKPEPNRKRSSMEWWVTWLFGEVPFIACVYVLRITHLNYLGVPPVNP